ncbi:50S ribosomal protein L18 [Candidatus Tremblaya phenacola]|uniref:50S ribosomal protein L18 n=1 Tax=Candidatus Tremblayella phenacoccinincola TaxID=1010676 RepID=A0A2G0V6W2_9PROT|nr:50S ribosomal protein L18 [Candidatus Tremblaya phenacola]PHN16201.1 50S ribosomal protein L18 [Candidatus Tremblaya phenacola]
MKHLTTKSLVLTKPKRTRTKSKKISLFRLVTYKSNVHLYAHVVSEEGNHIVTGISTIAAFKYIDIRLRKNRFGASLVGKLIATRAVSIGVNRITFDRSGFQYHGLIQNIAESARCYGLQF